jgi:hypothetical protein
LPAPFGPRNPNTWSGETANVNPSSADDIAKATAKTDQLKHVEMIRKCDRR